MTQLTKKQTKELFEKTLKNRNATEEQIKKIMKLIEAGGLIVTISKVI